MEIVEKLVKIQSKLNAPKNQRNKFGNYNYRSAEDILEAVKPLLAANGCSLVVSDEIVQLGARFYVKATANLCDGKDAVASTAYAREEESKKGMDAAQLTGATSSYARKYALNGLFAIDDCKDADATNRHGKEESAPTPPPPIERNFTKEEAQKMKDWADKKGANLYDRACAALGETDLTELPFELKSKFVEIVKRFEHEAKEDAENGNS